MRIAYIAAGAGGMYCGSCIRDNTLARALQARGHEVLLQPIYTPLRTDEASVADPTVRYGAVNLYLQQKSTLFGRLPAFLRRWLDHPALLRVLTRNAASTDATELGAMTLSMLMGESGRQAKELEGLVAFLRDDYRPDVIQLTNSMLLGLARRLRAELPDARIVTALQGEDIFLDDLREPYRRQVEEELRARAADSHAFVATSAFYADHMAEFLGVDRSAIHVTRLGIAFDGYRAAPAPEAASPLRIGYLARICPEKGLHLLVDAFTRLQEARPGSATLHVAGYLGGRDRGYYEEQERRIEQAGLASSVHFGGEVDRAGKLDFLHGLDVFSVPTVYREPKGLSVLEAMAAGVPVVQPDHGAFPELVGATGGGWLTRPLDAGDLARALERVLDHPEERAARGAAAHEGVRREYSEERMAGETVDAYESVLALAAARAS